DLRRKILFTLGLVALYRAGASLPSPGVDYKAVLVAAGAVRNNQLVKDLGYGENGVAVQVTADKVTGSAKEKITAAGGTVTELA
ncbi:uL15m family ribosomal protein, partial [Nocardia farcinica]|uniref:uL15m family ribosomal protein n=1 Tax=Nocardia farcinica TaxID=37329 RepID=UPI0024544549